MRLTGFMAAAAVLSMVAAPTLAAPANPAAALSLTAGAVRAGAPMKRSGKASQTTYIIAGVAVAAVIGGAIALSHHDNHSASS